ncbi:MAG: hypothetical protein Q8Q15_00850, partial [bacterium]|nr:hypothetical protein [bacterium]
MFPAQTSLIPVQIALARFLENQGWQAIFSDYPYWYLGTTPFMYLTGPILPIILAVLHQLLPTLSLFDFVWIILSICWIIGGLGVYALAKSLNHAEPYAEQRGAAVLAVLFYLFGPIVPFLFRFSDGVYLMAFSLIPLTLLRYLKFLRTPKFDPLLILLITFLILLDSQIIPTLVLGMAAMLMAESGWKRIEEKLKSSLVFLFFSFLVATLWYTPGYWWTLLGSPSFGGQGLVQVITWLGKLLPVALALTMAVVSGKFFKSKNLLRDFTFYWLFIFGFLTLIRFLSDPDFWLDWSAYGVELQFGGALALGGWLWKKLEDRRRRT